MTDIQTTVSPEVLCKALKDVLALEFDFASPSELAAAAVLSQKLMADPDMATTLAKIVAQYSVGGKVDVHRRRAAPFPALLRSNTTVVQDISALDWPTESNSERAEGREIAEVRVASTTAQDVDLFEGGERVALRNYHLVIYSPEVLGFPTETPKADWSKNTIVKWEHFFRLAEDIVSTRTTLPKKRRSNYLARALHSVRNQLSFSAEHKARNYSIVEYRAGEWKTHVHVLYDPDTLYVVVTRNEATTLRSMVRVENPDFFAKEIVDAFEGHRDNAMEAITSLRQELTH